MVQPIPENYPRLSPYLAVDGGAAAVDWYVEVLGAVERMRIPGPEGKLGHAELQFGDSVLMLADEWPEGGHLGPRTLGGSPVILNLYVEDVDAVFAKALERGAKELRAVQDQFYGDRIGSFEDPWGHRWSVATHVEDVSPEEMARRAGDAGA